MDKVGEVRVGLTACERCSTPISTITADGLALCNTCAAVRDREHMTKEAHLRTLPLKSASAQLVNDFK